MRLGQFEDWGSEWVQDVPAAEIYFPPEQIFIPQQSPADGGIFDKLVSAGEKLLPRLLTPQTPARSTPLIPSYQAQQDATRRTIMNFALGGGAILVAVLIARSFAK